MERELARIATDQHGVVSRDPARRRRRQRRSDQIAASQRGPPARISRGLSGRTSSAERRGRVTSPRCWPCGREPLLTGRAGGYCFGLARRARSSAGDVHAHEPARDGVATHQSRILESASATPGGASRDHVARTLVDLAAFWKPTNWPEPVTRPEFTHAHARCSRDRLGRRPSSPGAAKLREVLRGRCSRHPQRARASLSGPPTRRRAPATGDKSPGRGLDASTAAGPTQRLTVELDSYRYHPSRHAWERDRNREREAYARGDDFRRYTYGDVFESPPRCLPS